MHGNPQKVSDIVSKLHRGGMLENVGQCIEAPCTVTRMLLYPPGTATAPSPPPRLRLHGPCLLDLGQQARAAVLVVATLASGSPTSTPSSAPA